MVSTTGINYRMRVSGWGLYPQIDTELLHFDSETQLQQLLNQSESLIARGMGRSYGDSSLSEKTIISTRNYQKMLSFDPDSGLLNCQSGLTIAQLLQSLVPRGWFIPVTPGTKFVSIGGAIASDVHGKNHHKHGSFSHCIEQFRLMLADGQTVTCSRQQRPELFEATFGGMGLTGFILNVTIRLKPISSAYILQKSIKCENLEAVMQGFHDYQDWTYSVAWIDCQAQGKNLGRSLLMLGEHAEAGELPPYLANTALTIPNKSRFSIPCHFPSYTLNRYSISAFNALYYAKAGHNTYNHVDYDSYFYPLDSLHHWNRIYGKSGFIQYQCVLPMNNSHEGLSQILQKVSDSGLGSFLAVLKQFGAQNGLLSFPMPGYTLALDFPIHGTLMPLLEELDEITQSYGGRLYLSKDARMSKGFFNTTYQHSRPRFSEITRSVDPNKKFQSLQSNRLGI